MTDKEIEIEIEIPGYLKKHGITTVQDNLPPAHQVVPPAGILFRMIGDDLMNSPLVKRKPPTTKEP